MLCALGVPLSITGFHFNFKGPKNLYTSRWKPRQNKCRIRTGRFLRFTTRPLELKSCQHGASCMHGEIPPPSRHHYQQALLCAMVKRTQLFESSTHKTRSAATVYINAGDRLIMQQVLTQPAADCHLVQTLGAYMQPAGGKGRH